MPGTHDAMDERAHGGTKRDSMEKWTGIPRRIRKEQMH